MMSDLNFRFWDKMRTYPLIGATLIGFLFFACQRSDLKKELFSEDTPTRLMALGKLAQQNDLAKKKLLPFLLETLRSEDNQVVDRSEEALASLGQVAVPELAKFLSDPDPFIRLTATEVIGKMGVGVPGAVQALAQALGDPHPLVREEAGLNLGRSPETIGLLILALEDQNKEMAESSARILKLLDTPEAKDVLKKFHSKRKTS